VSLMPSRAQVVNAVEVSPGGSPILSPPPTTAVVHDSLLTTPRKAGEPDGGVREPEAASSVRRRSRGRGAAVRTQHGSLSPASRPSRALHPRGHDARCNQPRAGGHRISCAPGAPCPHPRS
jgi:hypothetical protein